MRDPFAGILLSPAQRAELRRLRITEMCFEALISVLGGIVIAIVLAMAESSHGG